MKKVVIIVQARMTSTRLPGKVLKQVLGRSLLSYLVERLKRVQLAHDLVVAIPQNKENDSLEREVDQLHVHCFRGDEKDVLSRYYEAAIKYQADVVIRITGDCPLIDPAVVDLAISSFLLEPCDYLSNTLKRTYPRGMDVEVFSSRVLKIAHTQAKEEWDREHVTPYIYNKMNLLKKNMPYIYDASTYRLTVDTIEDFHLVEKILQELVGANPRFTLEDILDLLRKKPELLLINSHVEQKGHSLD